MSDFFPSYRTKIEENKPFESDKRKNEKLERENGERDDFVQDKNDGQNVNFYEKKYELNGSGGPQRDSGEGEKVKQKKKKLKKKKGSSGESTPDDEENDDDLLPPSFPPASTRVYKESCSLDSGIESDCRGSISSDCVDHTVDEAFIAFLNNTNRHDDFLDGSVRYAIPKFTLNRVDNILAFTFHAKNVSPNSVRSEILPGINSARVKFDTTAPKVQNYAFFIKMPHTKNNNNNNCSAAMILEATAESWDNNVVFQIDLDPRCDDELSEYQAGIDQFHLTTYPMETKIESVPVIDEHTDEGFSVHVQNTSENEINIAIKAKEPLKLQQQQQQNDGAKRRNNKKQKQNRCRAYSESCCDELKVISESECLKLSSSAVNGVKQENTAGGIPVRKARSVSESYHEASSIATPITKYKSILKHSYDHSISMDSSVDDIFSATDHELSESCKKSVRFSDHITRQLYKSNSSILGQKKKNQRKNDAKKRAIERKNSEGESDANDFKENLQQDEDGREGRRGKNCSKSGNMIFDLEIDDHEEDDD